MTAIARCDDLCEHRKIDAIGRAAESRDFIVAAGFLARKIVRGKAEDDKAPIAVFGVDFLKRVILGRKPAFGRHVHHQPHLAGVRSEEHTSELQSLMRISYAVFCLKKKNQPLLLNLHTTCTNCSTYKLHQKK